MKSRTTRLSVFGGTLATVLTLAAAPVAQAADMIGNCALTGEKGSIPLTPVREGQLTVEVNLPAPGWWNGDTPETIADGFEYCMAANIAHRAGLDKLEVVNVAWDALVAGQTKEFDLALSQISITEERAERASTSPRSRTCASACSRRPPAPTSLTRS
jgi:polar amino acid transport system substrate-binding protein